MSENDFVIFGICVKLRVARAQVSQRRPSLCTWAEEGGITRICTAWPGWIGACIAVVPPLQPDNLPLP